MTACHRTTAQHTLARAREVFIITSSLLVSFVVPIDELANRCSITLTLLLAMVAFKYVVSEKLPNISYATIIDWYVLS